VTNIISSRTPEGDPQHCPICDTLFCLEPSLALGDAPCPSCGTLLWFFPTLAGMRFYESKAVAPLREKILQAMCEKLAVTRELLAPTASFVDDVGVDSLDRVELMMALEEEFGVSIPDDELEKIQTVGDAIDLLAKRKL
jgi:acyl carrier protein